MLLKVKETIRNKGYKNMNTEVDEINWEDLKAAADFYDKLKKEEHSAMQKREQNILQHQQQKFDNFIKTGSYYP